MIACGYDEIAYYIIWIKSVMSQDEHELEIAIEKAESGNDDSSITRKKLDEEEGREAHARQSDSDS